MARQPSQLFVDDRRHFVQGAAVPVAPLDQELRQVPGRERSIRQGSFILERLVIGVCDPFEPVFRRYFNMRGKNVLTGILIFTAAAFAQAPSGLAVKAATNKKVDLSWSGTASSYTVQRAILGGGFSNLATVTTGAAYSDTSVDAYTTYQYQIVANISSGTSSPSNLVTVGPPPAGFTNPAPAPGPPGGQASQQYGYNLSLVLDGNGDPAFAFIFYDPNLDGDSSDTRVEFLSWNRAAYKWNNLVHAISNIGESAATFHQLLALAYDASSNTFGIAVEVNDGDSMVLYLSTDGGTTWTRKTTISSPGDSVTSPSMVFAGGNIHLAYVLSSTGLKYVTGRLTSDPAAWTTKSEPKVSGVDIARQAVTLSLALDSSGSPAIAWWADDQKVSYNEILQFWKPAGGGAPVKVMDSQGQQSDALAVKLVFAGLNPRVLAEVQRADGGFGVTLHSGRSDNGGATWNPPVLIPPDGDRSTDYPFDLAVDSQGRGAAAIGSNGGSGGGVCGNPKFARTNDFVTWKTCDVANNLQATQNYSIFPGAEQVLFGSNDRVYFLWWDDNGIIMYREPPASAITGPNISSVVNGATFQPGIVAGSWTTILGANFSDATRIWGDSDFNNGNVLPTNLSGVSVKINGLDAPVYFISPGQVNVQAPANINGNVNVVVTHNGVASNTATANAVSVSPGLFTYALGGKTYPSALYNGTFTIVGDPALYGAAAKAKAGDIIQLYATGLGPSPAGNIISSPIGFSGTVTATIGTANATVLGAALVAVGEFQVNIQVPSGLADGDYQLLIKVNGTPCQTGVVIPIGH
jgi:uncharacterized protein (TIGR03437 family)